MPGCFSRAYFSATSSSLDASETTAFPSRRSGAALTGKYGADKARNILDDGMAALCCQNIGGQPVPRRCIPLPFPLNTMPPSTYRGRTLLLDEVSPDFSSLGSCIGVVTPPPSYACQLLLRRPTILRHAHALTHLASPRSAGGADADPTRRPRGREAAFRGGPSAQEHPDLFRLVEKHQQNQGGGDISSPPKKGNRSGSNADTNGATGALVAMKEGTSSSSSEQSGGTIGTTTSEQKNQRLGGAGVDVAKPAASLLPSDGERADEEAPPSRVRGQQGKEWVAVVEEGQKTPEPGGSPEKCPW